MQIKRDIYINQLIDSMHNGMIKIVTGMRRSGKSYLLFILFYEYLKKKGISDNNIIKIDLEDRRNKNLRNPDTLIEYIDSKIQNDEMHYILLDEVQYVAEFEDVLNSYLKVKNADVYVTGSNSKFLSKDIATEFRGRGYEIRVFPLCFSEFFSGYENTREKALEEYITYGGLPKILEIKEESKKANYLKGLFETVYVSDIIERYKIKNDADFEELINIISSSIGGLINPNKIENTFESVKKSKVSANTIKNYLDILQDVFMIEKSTRYDIKGRKYINTPAKYYFSDLGLRNARINFRQNEVTHLIENLIYNELRVRGFSVDVGSVVLNTKNNNGESLRKQLEVDFVCNLASKRLYIQSAYGLPNEQKLEQEIKSLNNIDDSFLKFVITADPIKKYQNDNGIIFMNIYDFLLDKNSLN